MSENREPLKDYLVEDKILIYSKAMFYFFLSGLVCVGSYLIWANPEINYNRKIQLEINEQVGAELKLAELQKWKYDEFSDVDTKEEKYPIVVLRTGFKVLKVENEHALVGWNYEVANTSRSKKYDATVTFNLEDEDGFQIASGTGSEPIQPKSFGIISGIMKVSLTDMKRLNKSGWRIGLEPAWVLEEEGSEGSRYDRLKEIVVDSGPIWLIEYLETHSEAIIVLSPKWRSIKDAIDAAKKKKDA